MQMRRRTRRDPDALSATELAEMGICEQRVLLRHRFGPRLTEHQHVHMEQGLRAHRRYRDEGLSSESVAVEDGRCFIATCLFGNSSWQAESLRRYRDDVMLPHTCGRIVVRLYYAVSPTICAGLRRYPDLQPFMRRTVSAFALHAARRQSVQQDAR